MDTLCPYRSLCRSDKGHLYDYNTTLYIDPDSAKAMMREQEAVTWWALLKEGMKRGHLGPVLTHPGLFRGVHDGRNKFARYFTPAQHHIPREWDTLLRYNRSEEHTSAPQSLMRIQYAVLVLK